MKLTLDEARELGMWHKRSNTGSRTADGRNRLRMMTKSLLALLDRVEEVGGDLGKSSDRQDRFYADRLLDALEVDDG